MNTCVVVIPVYKEIPQKPTEVASFRQCINVLANYKICLVTYKELDITWYIKTAREFGKELCTKYYDARCFSSVQGYNSLCLSIDFYSTFADYDYMLIYQLDAWVFRDELQALCDKGFDYVGAPLFQVIRFPDVYSKKMIGVGNGGLSLRRVAYCIRLLSCHKNLPFCKPKFVLEYISNKPCWRKMTPKDVLRTFIQMFGYKNNVRYYVTCGVHEDLFFSLYAGHSWTAHANLPSVEEAKYFSFEIHPSYLYSLTRRLPFGCHAFDKWEYKSFWEKHMQHIVD